MLLRPPSLQKGDTVYVLSTAKKINEQEIACAVDTYKTWGLNVVIGKTIGAEQNQFAGDDELRRVDFQHALDDANVKAIVCARGGYGTVRMMDALNYDEFMKHPKWIIGFSDITYLHTHISNNIGTMGIHGQMPIQFEKSTPEAIETLRKELFGEKNEYIIEPHPLNRTGQTKGTLIGGNLSILYSITGTRSGMNTDRKILFLEDLDEYIYHIDRMMMNLKRSGKLHGLAGLIVGGFSDMHDNAIPFGKTAYEVIAEHVAEYNFPVCFNFPAGHIYDNRALVIGKTYSLNVEDKQVTLS
ncbi:MAG TPA: LD-carboxypeptidase [Chitinophagales bacterium]|nr:LD-carboxypeptidase [Chitinophagales bacterium]